MDKGLFPLNLWLCWTCPVPQMVTRLSVCSAGSLGQEGPLEEGMVSHSSVLPWKILWTEEPGGLQSMESQRVEHN